MRQEDGSNNSATGRRPFSKKLPLAYCYHPHIVIMLTDTSSRQKGRPTSANPQMSDSNKNLVLGPRWSLTPGLTDRWSYVTWTVARDVNVKM
jgi:hypothetical protein